MPIKFLHPKERYLYFSTAPLIFQIQNKVKLSAMISVTFLFRVHGFSLSFLQKFTTIQHDFCILCELDTKIGIPV